MYKLLASDNPGADPCSSKSRKEGGSKVSMKLRKSLDELLKTKSLYTYVLQDFYLFYQYCPGISEMLFRAFGTLLKEISYWAVSSAEGVKGTYNHICAFNKLRITITDQPSN